MWTRGEGFKILKNLRYDIMNGPLRVLHLVVDLQQPHALGLKVPDHPQPEVVPPPQLGRGGEGPLRLDEPLVPVLRRVVVGVGVGVDPLDTVPS